MRHICQYLILLVLLTSSCRKVKEYLQKPDTSSLTQTVNTTYAVGYSANIAMTVMSGHELPFVTVSRSNSGYPCTSLIDIDVKNDNTGNLLADHIETITIAGLYSSEHSAVLTVLFSNFNMGTSNYALLGIKTFPVIRRLEDNQLAAVFASMEVHLQPNRDTLLEINLTDLQVSTELARLDSDKPNDLYIAVDQNGYFIDIHDNNTEGNIADDSYIITGGGQLIEVTNTSAEILQQAMLEVKVSSLCLSNPTSGYALVKKTGTKDQHFPELGTAILKFHESCDAKTLVELATGCYVSSNGKWIGFNLN